MTKTGSSSDLYEILGVPPDASAQDIKKAFRIIARECHPDVAGTDAAKLERFKRSREAYEVLADPAARSRYDRRGERRESPFVGSFWNRGTVNVGAGPGAGKAKPKSDLDLEDIFNDFSGVGDFGFGGKKAPAGTGVPPRTPPRPAPRPPPRASKPQPGKDVTMAVDVPWEVAERGGTVTVRYPRLRRAEDGRTLYRYDELHELKVPPGTTSGEALRVEKLGDAGTDGGPYGELVCEVRVTGEKPHAVNAAGAGRMKMPSRDHPDDGILRVDVGVTTALLGGRVAVHTPQGPVRVAIPAGTSSGTRMRLRGRGAAGEDLVAEVRIVVPKVLDDESRALIERFAALNPTDGE